MLTSKIKTFFLALAFYFTQSYLYAQSDANQWTWIGGDSSNTSLLVEQFGQWGNKGVASISNYPSARTRSVSWTDAQGNYWVFGGRGYDGAGNNGLLNDLWKYNPNTKEWTWVSGDNAVNAIGVYSGAVKPGARQGAIGWADASGNLWLFSGNGYASYAANATITPGVLNDVWRFNVATSQWSFIRGGTIINPSGTPSAREGAVSWSTNDGKLWMMGGLTQNGRINDLWNYNPTSNSWSYVKGCTCFDQIGNYGNLGVASFSNVPGARQDAMSFTDNIGNLWLFGGQGRDSANNFGFLNDLWKYEIATNTWTWLKGSKRISQTGVYGTKGLAAVSNTPGARSGGDSWTDADGKLYLFGGSGSASFSDVWVFDPSTTFWTWKAGTSTASPAAVHGTKQIANTSNLPGGTSGAMAWRGAGNKILIFGGTSLNNRRVTLLSNELWEFDVNTNLWSWQNGSSNFIVAPQYGVRGLASANNYPGARRLAATWKDKEGNFWLFGGLGFADSLSAGNLNDLWKYNPVSKSWTWIAGSSKVNQIGVYGTRGVASPNNIPGGRYGGAGWVDTSGNVWIFGGTQGSALFNDLWQYNPLTDRWTWFRGSNGPNSALGVYGTRGLPAASNTPSAKEGTVYGIDNNGNLWLFGGRGVALTNEFGLMNDLWRFTPSLGQWAWMGGSGTRNAPPFYGTQGVAGSSLPGGRQYASGTIDNEGNFYLFGGDGIDELGTQGILNDLWRYNLQSGQWAWMKGNTTRNILSVAGTLGFTQNSNNPGGRTAPALWTDGLGTLWLFGGNGLGTTTGSDFLQDLWKYDPASNNWTWTGGANTTFPSYNYGQKNIAAAGNRPLARNATAAWYGNDGALYTMGGIGRFNNTNTQLNYNDLWKYQLPCSVKADFQLSNQEQCLSGNLFTLTNTTKAVGNALTYEWVLGDGTTSDSKELSHTYAQEGVYAVKLIAKLGTCVDSLSKTIRVLQSSASLTAVGSTSLCEGQLAVLKATSGNNLSYAWQKDGVDIPSVSDSLYNTAEAGNYKVTVTNTLSGCSAISNEITITTKPRPEAPTGAGNQVFCNKSKVSDLIAEGTDIRWYAAQAGGDSLKIESGLNSQTTYYASQTLDGCESNDRLPVAVTINTTSQPTGAATQTFCNSATITDLAVTGADIKWYVAASGGTPVSGTDALQNNINYYASQTLNNCESENRLEVKALINITSTPGGTAAQNFCGSATLSDLTVTGANIKWYDQFSGGNALLSTTALQSGVSYYASQTENNCESAGRLEITPTINAIPSAPSGNASQSFCVSANLSQLNASGNNLKWYDAATGGNILNSATALQDGVTYYASQTEGNCESLSRLSVTVTINTTPQPTGNATQTFCNNANVANLSVSGVAVQWYDALTGGNVLSLNSALQSGTSYYASQTQNNCESPIRLAVSVKINNTQPPTGSAAQAFCNSAKISDLNVNGADLKWYDALTGGNVLSLNSALQSGVSYYASQTQNNCESPSRLAVAVTINTALAPTGSLSQTFCNSATIGSMNVTGDNVKWYDAATSGNLLAGTAALQNGKTYYASQTLDGCESNDRLPVAVTINTTSQPTGAATQTFCNSATVTDLAVTGADIKWYVDASGGTPVSGTEALQNNINYYASQTLNNCESENRLEVKALINITSIPGGTAAQNFCGSATLSDLNVTGANIKWYDQFNGGNALPLTTALQSGLSYYASQTENNCESAGRLEITPTINAIPSAPSGNASQSFCVSASLSQLNASGNNLKWYDAATGGNILNSTTALQDGVTYYASQTEKNCESISLLSVTVIINTTPQPTGNATQTFCNNATVANLSVSGVAVQWYDALMGGNVLSLNSALQSGTSYYASQTQNNCESPLRLAVTVTINNTQPPTGSAAQSFCNSAKISDLNLNGADLKWYDALTGGNVLSLNSALQSGASYYASQTQNNCESAVRLAVKAVINTAPSAPSGINNQSFCDAATINDLVVSGVNVKWYDAATGGSLLSVNSPLQTGKIYFASQSQNNCESVDRKPVSVLITPKPSKPLIFINGYDLISSAPSGNQWYVSGMLISGATGQTYRPSQAGTYMVKVIENACESDFSEIVNFVSGGGDYVRIYPNPATDFILVNWAILAATNLNVAIFNSNGHQVAAFNNLSTGTKIPVSQLKSGLYLLYLTTPDGRQEYVLKFVKQ